MEDDDSDNLDKDPSPDSVDELLDEPEDDEEEDANLVEGDEEENY